MRAGAARVLLALIAVVLSASNTTAKLMFRTDDVCVRGADLIGVGNSATTDWVRGTFIRDEGRAEWSA